jgi:hypothetical protein
VFERRMLRRMFGSMRDEVTGGWRKLHNENSSPSVIRNVKPMRIRLARHVAQMGEKRTLHRLLICKPEGK